MADPEAGKTMVKEATGVSDDQYQQNKVRIVTVEGGLLSQRIACSCAGSWTSASGALPAHIPGL